MLSQTTMLDRFLASDASYDGRFITGVVTTGIYCRPSCRARKPLPENVRFFRSPDAARDAGLRPCIRCRPDDEDPGDADLELANGIVERLRLDPSRVRNLNGLARLAGVGMTTLNEIVRRHYHSTPAAILRRERIEAASRLLTGSRDSIVDVAHASGFESVSSFNENFRRATGLAPRDYRHLQHEFPIALPRNYARAFPLRYMGRDAESETERADTNGFVKSMLLDGTPSVIEVTFSTTAAVCRLTGTRSLRGFIEGHRAALRLLGLPFDPAPFERRVSSDAALAPLIASRRGLRVPRSATVFESLMWAIVGQQVNLAFAYKLRRVIIELAGRAAGPMRAHPDAAAVAQLDYSDLTSRQFSRRKAEYLIDTARLVAAGDLDVESLGRGSAIEVERRLLAVRGFGAWSTNYAMMRGCGFADCVPLGDTGLTSSLKSFFSLNERPDREMTATLMQQFAPFRSLATFHFWMRLSDGAL